MNRFVLLSALFLLSVACTGSSPVVPFPGSATAVPPATMAPAAPPVVVATSVPTSTPLPTVEPSPTPTMLSISTPVPTLAPWPTAALLPLSTPVPTMDWEFPSVPDRVALPTLAIYRSVGSSILPEKVASLLEDGADLLDLGLHAEAVLKFEQAELEYGGPLNEAQNWIGLSHLQLGDYYLAIEHFTRSISAGDSVQARANRAIAYPAVNMCLEAVPDALAALDMEPLVSEDYHSDVAAHLSLSTCFVRSEDYALSLEHADMAVSLAGDHGFRDERSNELSVHRNSIEDVAMGDSYVEDLLSTTALGHFVQGRNHLDQGRYEKAIVEFESAQAHTWAPSGLILDQLGLAYSALGYYESALRYLSLVLEVRDDGYGRVRRALEYLYLGDCENALIDAEAALDVPSVSVSAFHSVVEVLWVRGSCRAEDGRLSDASVDLRESIISAKKFGYSHDILSAMVEGASDLVGELDLPPAVLASDSGFDCDTVLRQQLVFQRGATNAIRINQVIERVQDMNEDFCSPEVWNPVVDDANFVNTNSADRSTSYPAVETPSAAELAGEGCWLADVWSADASGAVAVSSFDATGDDALVGSSLVPAGLRNGNELAGTVRRFSGRDSENNIIVYWSADTFERPADGARCWLYVVGAQFWDETY